MLTLLLLTVVLVAACFLIGQGVLAACGSDTWRWWAPAVGFAVLLIIGGQVVHIPNHGTELLVLIVVFALGSLALPMVRRAVVEAGLEAAVFTVLLTLAAAIPFFAIGYAGVLGAGVSNDMSQHLTAAFYLRTGHGLRPVAALGGNLITTGYPLGPHGLVALLTRATGAGEETTFSAVTLAIPVLTGMAALGVVPSARRGARWTLAAIVGLGYLPMAYLAQGSFKETGQALLVFGAALALMDLTRSQPPRGLRRGVPIALIVGGSIYNYSYGGAFWIVGTIGVMLLAEIIRRPRAVIATLRATLLPVLGALIVAAAVIAPEISRIQEFAKSIFGVEPLTNHGNLFHAVNPLETLGVWFSGDFRFNSSPVWPSSVLDALGLAALVLGALWWIRRRSLALPAAVVASIAIWIDLALTRNVYNAAKGLVVMAPVVMTCLGAPLAAAWSESGRSVRMRRAIVAARAVGVVLLACAAVSSFAVLRSAPVGLGPHEGELARIQSVVYGKPVLYLANDHFAQWELRGADVYVISRLYITRQLPPNLAKGPGPATDIDNYVSSDLDRMDYVVTPAAAYRSEIPPNFRLILRTPSYELFRRVGSTPTRQPLDPPGEPGVLFNCGTAQGQQYLKQYRWAGVLPTPVVLTDWQGSIGVPGDTARIPVRLPRGRWDVSLQYISYTKLVVRGPALHRAIPANYGEISPFWPAGTLTSDGRAFTLSVTSQKRTWFAQLLGRPRGDISPDSPDRTPIWHVAFTSHGATPRRVDVHAACGRYVDWFAPAGSTMRGR